LGFSPEPQNLFEEAINFTLNIDFSQSKTDDTVSLFESTIRYVGGMLSAYELDGKKDQRLVKKAQDLADKLIHGWVGNNDIPYNGLNFTTNQPMIEEASILPISFTTAHDDQMFLDSRQG
jgi:mannosyl-oligosaccharide alpha-1,2-mannosidase